jgi:hypothetical protein
MCDVALESTSQVVGFTLRLGVFYTVQAPCTCPEGIPYLGWFLDGFLAAYLVPSGVFSQLGHAVRIWV